MGSFSAPQASLYLPPPEPKAETRPVMKPTPRPYQREALQAIQAAMDRGIERALLVMPTGTGKTSVFAWLIEICSEIFGEDFEALIVAHRSELLTQAADRIGTLNPHLVVTIESGDQQATEGADVVVAGVQSIGRPGTKRLNWIRPKIIIIDEAHHAPADSYQNVLRSFGGYDGSSFVLGVTATPHRLDNKPLHGTERAIFEEVVYSYTLRQAIKEGWLCDLRGYRASADGLDLSSVKTTAGDYNQGDLQRAMNTDPNNEIAFKSWTDVASDRQTIVFCTGVEHADDVAEVFRAHGVRAAAVNGAMKMEDRERIMREFKAGEIQVLTNMDIATEGFDSPEVSCVLMLRPTQSWSLYTQMIGRGLRIAEGKTDCIVIDIVGNSERHSLGAKPQQGKAKEKAPASLAGLVDLPPELDLEGHSVLEALALWEELDEQAQAAQFKRCTTFRGLTQKLQEVDLLEELTVPEEVAGVSRFAWLKIGNDHYQVGCGSSTSEQRRRAQLQSDPLGFWVLTLHSDMRDERFELGVELAAAFEKADSIIAREFEGAGAVASASAKWRSQPPTEKQLYWLKRKGVDEDIIARLNKGTASAMLDKLMGQRGKR